MLFPLIFSKFVTGEEILIKFAPSSSPIQSLSFASLKTGLKKIK